MGKISSEIVDFLANGGSELGFSDEELPALGQFNDVLRYGITVWDYKGMTKEEYYGGNR
tara:strand:- start:36432 stop:36608 length:177 start_codon:yes stop_codon:yes gene_type:complete